MAMSERDPMQMSAEECVIELTADGYSIVSLQRSRDSDGYTAAARDGFRLLLSAASGEPANALRALVAEARGAAFATPPALPTR